MGLRRTDLLDTLATSCKTLVGFTESGVDLRAACAPSSHRSGRKQAATRRPIARIPLTGNPPEAEAGVGTQSQCGNLHADSFHGPRTGSALTLTESNREAITKQQMFATMTGNRSEDVFNSLEASSVLKNGHGLLAPPSKSPTDLPRPVDNIKADRLEELGIMLIANALVTLFDDGIELIRPGTTDG